MTEEVIVLKFSVVRVENIRGLTSALDSTPMHGMYIARSSFTLAVKTTFCKRNVRKLKHVNTTGSLYLLKKTID